MSSRAKDMLQGLSRKLYQGHFIVKLLAFAGVATAFFYVVFLLVGLALQLAPEPIGSRAPLFIEGAKTTLYLTIASGALGIFIGIFWGLSKVGSVSFLRWPANFFIWLIRGTPLLVQILFVYYALPMICPFLKFGEFTAGLIALSLNVGAYNAEVIRAGIEAIPKGQIEAARSLGLSRFKTTRFIVLPQAMRIVVPPLVNNLAALLKDSSLVSSIGLLELTLSGSRITSETFQPAPVLLTVAAIYLLLTTILTAGISFLKKGTRFYVRAS